MKSFFEILCSFHKYSDFTVLIEGIGTKILASYVVIQPVYQCTFRMDDGFFRSSGIDSFTLEESNGFYIGFYFRRVSHTDSYKNPIRYFF